MFRRINIASFAGPGLLSHLLKTSATQLGDPTQSFNCTAVPPGLTVTMQLVWYIWQIRIVRIGCRSHSCGHHWMTWRLGHAILVEFLWYLDNNHGCTTTQKACTRFASSRIQNPRHEVGSISPSGNLLHSYGKIHHFLWENPLFPWPFSTAMFVYQKVYQPYPDIIHRSSIYKPCINHILTIYKPYINHLQTIYQPHINQHIKRLQSPCGFPAMVCRP